MGFVCADADRTDLVAGDVPAPAQQRENPARIGILPAADVHAEPDHVLEARAVAFLPVDLARLGRIGDQLLGLRHGGTVSANQRGGDIFGAALGHQAGGEAAVLIVELDRLEQGLEEALAILLANGFGGRRIDPFGVDLGSPQH